MSRPRSYQRLLAELKRCHVFKVAAVYGGVSFVVLQLADIIFPNLGLPDWALTFVVALLLLGFPIALVLAWAFEMKRSAITARTLYKIDVPDRSAAGSPAIGAALSSADKWLTTSSERDWSRVRQSLPPLAGGRGAGLPRKSARALRRRAGGQSDGACDAYAYFVEAWADADPELQPMVEEAKRSMVRLREDL